MVPLKRSQGLPFDELITLIASRPVYIFGAGEIALAVLLSLKKSGIKCAGFLNTQHQPKNAHQFGLKVITPEALFEANNPAFIVIASQAFLAQAQEICEKYGYQNHRDYLSFHHISRPEVVIDVVEDINLFNGDKLSWPADFNPKYMSVSRYQKVIDKLCNDQPNMTKVNLAEWGDALWHPELAKVIHITQSKEVICSIKTYLLELTQLHALASKSPLVLNISVIGGEQYYAQYLGGQAWPQLLANIVRLGELLQQAHHQTQVIVRYAPMRRDSAADKATLKALCVKYHFSWMIEDAYIMPYERLLDVLSDDSARLNSLSMVREVPWDVAKWTQVSRQDADNSCLPQRIFPVVNFDESVGICHVYKQAIVANNVLELSREALLEQRGNCQQCVKCQSFGMHRLDLHVLKRRYPNE